VSLDALLAGKQVCICAGAGGVGKTTTAAAIALGAAARGQKVVVVTIDPAKRLATALGLEELGNEPRRVDPELLAAHAGTGELWAMMLDAKRTFDELIERLAADAETRDQILGNRIYQELSSAVAGSQEFTAIAKLYELDRERDFDLLVLDTPPSRNALDFLDAPERLSDFFEGRALRMFLRPTGLGMRIVGRGTGVLFGALRRITGIDLLEDLSLFFRALGGMIDDFRARATQVGDLLGDPATTFVLISSPEPEPVQEAIFFHRKLAEAEMPFGGVIVNRVHHRPPRPAAAVALREELDSLLQARLAGKVLENLAERSVLAARDAGAIARLTAELGGKPPVALVPHLDDDVHDVAGLALIERHLFDGNAAV
jgi:anion-transporting  ArsA/GET3 family ATPase